MDEGGDLDLPEAGVGEALDRLELERRGDRGLLELEAIPRADLADGDGVRQWDGVAGGHEEMVDDAARRRAAADGRQHAAVTPVAELSAPPGV